MALNWIELDDDQDPLVIWKMGTVWLFLQVNVSPDVLCVKGQGKDSCCDPLELAQWLLPPNSVHSFFQHYAQRFAQCCPGGAGQWWEGKVSMDFIKELVTERNHEEQLKFWWARLVWGSPLGIKNMAVSICSSFWVLWGSPSILMSKAGAIYAQHCGPEPEQGTVSYHFSKIHLCFLLLFCFIIILRQSLAPEIRLAWNS